MLMQIYAWVIFFTWAQPPDPSWMSFHISNVTRSFGKSHHYGSSRDYSSLWLPSHSLLHSSPSVQCRLVVHPSSIFGKWNQSSKNNQKWSIVTTSLRVQHCSSYLCSTSVTLLIQTHFPSVSVSVRPIQNALWYHLEPVFISWMLILTNFCTSTQRNRHF